MIFIVFLNYYRGCCLKICSHMTTSRDKGLYILNHNTMDRHHAFSLITQGAGKSPSQSTHLHRALETLQAVPEDHHFSIFLWSAVCRTSQKQSSSGRQYSSATWEHRSGRQLGYPSAWEDEEGWARASALTGAAPAPMERAMGLWLQRNQVASHYFQII